MSKSKTIFIVLFIGYISIAFLNAFGILSAGSIVLFGLSLSALLTSLSDATNGLINYLCQKNQMNFIAKCSIAFIGLKLRLSSPQSTNITDVVNIRKNLENQYPHYLESVHPSEYFGRRRIKILRNIICFLDSGSFLSFIITPFIKNQQLNLTKISVFITLCAFGCMCLNIFISELQNDYAKKQIIFYNSENILINLTYPEFAMFLDSQLNHRARLLATKELGTQGQNETQMETNMSIMKPVEDYYDVSNK